jgi:glucose uptake protein GlcU
MRLGRLGQNGWTFGQLGITPTTAIWMSVSGTWPISTGIDLMSAFESKADASLV